MNERRKEIDHFKRVCGELNSALPDPLDAVLVEDTIGGNDGHSGALRLHNEQAVERVFVMKGQHLHVGEIVKI